MRETAEGRAIDAQLGLLIAQHHALEAQIVSRMSELDELQGWQGDGYRSMAQWLSVRGGCTISEARRFATAASRLEHIRSIHADADARPDVVPDPDIDYWQRRWVDELGRERYDLALDGPTGALFKEAWQAARAAGEKALGDVDRSERIGHDRAGRRALLRAGVRRSRDARSGARLRLRPRAASASRLTLLHPGDGEAADRPRARTHHVRLARAAARASQRLGFRAGVTGCESPGCTQTRFVDAHHVRFYENRGPTDLDNLVLLCGYHHRQIHDHGGSITTAGDQRFTFWHGERCLGTTVRGDSTRGRPPDVRATPRRRCARPTA